MQGLAAIISYFRIRFIDRRIKLHMVELIQCNILPFVREGEKNRSLNKSLPLSPTRKIYTFSNAYTFLISLFHLPFYPRQNCPAVFVIYPEVRYFTWQMCAVYICQRVNSSVSRCCVGRLPGISVCCILHFHLVARHPLTWKLS